MLYHFHSIFYSPVSILTFLLLDWEFRMVLVFHGSRKMWCTKIETIKSLEKFERFRIFVVFLSFEGPNIYALHKYKSALTYSKKPFFKWFCSKEHEVDDRMRLKLKVLSKST